MIEISQKIKNEYMLCKIEEALENRISNACFLKLTNDKSNYRLNIISKNNKISKKDFNVVEQALKGFNVLETTDTGFVIDKESIQNFISLCKLQGTLKFVD